MARSDFDAAAALKACGPAVKAAPTVARLHYQLGRAAYVLEDYATARAEFQIAADGGYKIAAASLGILYDHGFGVPRDEQKAIEFYKTAADEIGVAAHNLAILYRDSAETPHDYDASLTSFKTAVTLATAIPCMASAMPMKTASACRRTGARPCTGTGAVLRPGSATA